MKKIFLFLFGLVVVLSGNVEAMFVERPNKANVSSDGVPTQKNGKQGTTFEYSNTITDDVRDDSDEEDVFYDEDEETFNGFNYFLENVKKGKDLFDEEFGNNLDESMFGSFWVDLKNSLNDESTQKEASKLFYLVFDHCIDMASSNKTEKFIFNLGNPFWLRRELGSGHLSSYSFSPFFKQESQILLNEYFNRIFVKEYLIYNNQGLSDVSNLRSVDPLNEKDMELLESKLLNDVKNVTNSHLGYRNYKPLDDFLKDIANNDIVGNHLDRCMFLNFAFRLCYKIEDELKIKGNSYRSPWNLKLFKDVFVKLDDNILSVNFFQLG